MRQALFLLVILGLQFAVPAFGSMPELNLDKLCKTRAADARIARLEEAQSVSDCVNDERNARGDLSAVWGSTSSGIRNQCVRDSKTLGTIGYVDLLACIEITEDTKPEGPKRK
jgi:hypothetical protein